jgi:hypothetical protein
LKTGLKQVSSKKRWLVAYEFIKQETVTVACTMKGRPSGKTLIVNFDLKEYSISRVG